jgi:protein-tyrosine phosphatase
MKKILFVCLGNICRSPLAEAIFNEKIKKNELSGKLIADSAGTASYHVGESPDPRTIEVASNHGIPVSHKGQQFKKRHSDEFDYLIAMDSSNYQNMLTEIGDQPGSLFLMREFDKEGKGKDVPDPYYGGMNGFEEMYQILDRSTDELLKFLQKKHDL